MSLSKFIQQLRSTPHPSTVTTMSDNPPKFTEEHRRACARYIAGRGPRPSIANCPPYWFYHHAHINPGAIGPEDMENACVQNDIGLNHKKLPLCKVRVLD